MRPPNPFPPSGSAGLWLLYHILGYQAIAEREGGKTFPWVQLTLYWARFWRSRVSRQYSIVHSVCQTREDCHAAGFRGDCHRPGKDLVI